MDSYAGAREAWKLIGRGIGDFQARVLLTAFYFSVLAPFGLLVRSGADPPGAEGGSGTRMAEARGAGGGPFERAGRQF